MVAETQFVGETLSHEQALLACAMADDSVAASLSTKDSDFTEQQYRDIHHAIRALAARGDRASADAVHHELNRASSAVSLVFVHELTVPSTANWEFYQERIIERAQRSEALRIVKDSGLIERLELKPGEKLSDRLSMMADKLRSVSERTGDSDGVDLPVALQERTVNLVHRAKHPEVVYRSGYKLVDSATQGFEKQQLIVIGARPSVGKTALALGIGKRMVQDGHCPAYFSLETSRHEIAARLMGSVGVIPSQRLKSGLQDVFRDAYDRGVLALKDLHFRIYDIPSCALRQLEALPRSAVREGVDIIFVDYLQRVSSHGETPRFEHVTKISNALKDLARSLDVPVVALSQLRRTDGTPQLIDLRESGAIEQDADVVLCLHRDRGHDSLLSDEATLTVAKKRNGPLCSGTLQFDPGRTLFYEEAS